MPWSNSVSLRYSPPTCFLEISLKRSLLSLWSGQCARKYIRFQLIFDAPQSANEQEFVISGDVFALEELYQVVKQYAEQFFNRDRSQTNTSQFLLEDFLESSSHSGSRVLPPPLTEGEISTDLTQKPNSSIHIQPQGTQNHQLYLGVLAPEDSDPMIQLGNLQLLDLVTALEECNVDLMAIAPLKPPFKTMSWSFTKWIIGAAALLTLGFTAVTTTTKNHRHPSPPPLSQPTLHLNSPHP